METFVFIFTGFIDSGKTTLLRDTLSSPDFEAYRNLIIVCEEGDEEYSEAFLKENHAFIEYIDNASMLTDEYLQELADKYTPDQVLIEYNGTWPMANLIERELPDGWEYGGIYSTVDCETVEMYLANMRQLFMEQFSMSGLVIFNNCDDSVDRVRIRRIFKAFNPSVQLIFERADGSMYDPKDDPLPFNINADVIEIDDIDFGVWYIDALEMPEHYEGKKLKFLAQLYRGSDLPMNTFVPGRFVMTCCEDDIKFMGFVCEYEGDFGYKQRDWVTVTVSFETKFIPEYGEKAPVLKLIEAKPANKPSQDPVFFS